MVTDRFASVAEAYSRIDSDNADLASPLLAALPVTGASISTLGSLLGTQTVDATDDLAARIDELQFDLGEGPCWDAFRTGRPVLEPQFRKSPRNQWPALVDALASESVGSLFAFPLAIGPLRIGAVDLYAAGPRTLDEADAEGASMLCTLVSRHVMRRALRATGIDTEVDSGDRFSRRAVHQATGFVIAQLGVSADDAHLLIQGRAFAENRPMTAVAVDIVERRIVFSADGGMIAGAE
jgi:hypothetical protein